MSPKKVFLYLFIASVSLSALIGIGVILFGSFGDLEIRVLLTTLTITITSILGLACGAYLERKGVQLPLAGIIIAVIAASLWLIVIWRKGTPSEWYIKTTVTFTILAYACSHLSLLSLARLEKKFVWIRAAAHFLIWSLAGLAIFILWAEPSDYELVSRIIGVLAILVAVVTIVSPVFHRLSAEESEADIEAEIAQLQQRIQELERKKARVDGTKFEETK